MHYTHSHNLSLVYSAFVEMMAVLNSSQTQTVLLNEAGVTIDRALKPLLMRIAGEGPIGLGELAERVGRDHTTVSRQVAKLEKLGLVKKQAGREDRRAAIIAIAPDGARIVDALNAARGRMFEDLLKEWSQKDQRDLVRLMGKFAEDTKARVRVLTSKTGPEGG